ncbi:hypothetical protein ONA91_25375 [Micromonospora sp. DR5-3]|uniref:hypothetical protein n=1 Tax=unclassified Micromonospora TaxID=2617518 RepID=UPI0011D4761D|nr:MULTISPECIES: hypothetical protein [unclassified Micromonospora]MCW3817786.1 hypothetical protein [Micromonospora sp. DR5-3]TYC21965.1 hypothetical protein FXF52_23395 [Micromonospora sp. MP36]
MAIPLRRAVAASAAALITVAGLTACSPEIKGVTGVSVDGSGQPVAMLAWCASHPPDVVLLFDATADDRHPRRTEWDWPGREYRVPDDATSPATVPLTGFPPSTLPTGVVDFAMYAATDDNSFSAARVTFRLADLAGLKPGLVLVTGYQDESESLRELTLEEFARRGAEEC